MSAQQSWVCPALARLYFFSLSIFNRQLAFKER